MLLLLRLVALALLPLDCALYAAGIRRPMKRHYDTHNYYALEHIPGVSASLEEVASALGVEVVEQAGELKDVWLVRVPKSLNDLYAREGSSGKDPVISTFKDLQERAENPLVSRSEDGLQARRIVSSISFLEPQIPAPLVKRAPPSIASSKAVAKRLGLKDPLFTEQWHLVNDGHPEHSMNTTPVWDMGYTGKGVLTSFLDDGLDFESEDLKDAFDAKNSHDFNDHVDLPRPVTAFDNHGTRCAGQVVARRNNACGVGIAYDAKAAGVRILGGPITTVDEAAAINFGFHDVGVYSCSWGPRDDGRTMEGPNYLVRKAVLNGINEGRGGKGSIFIFASGNGGYFEDQCNYDGYTNSIYSVTVSAVDWKGIRPDYSEACAANMIAAYSSGSGKFIVTCDKGKNSCTKHHGGTSAAAPNAVGVVALALEARPDLAWRDIQHLCVLTARQINPNDPDWEKTASGRPYSYKYGYGALDASRFVTAAKDWKLVKPQAWIHTETTIFNNGKLTSLGHHKYKYEGGKPIPKGGIEAKMTITKEMMLENNLEALEHVDVRVWIEHKRRGDVKVELVSPAGVKSVLAAGRQYDDADTGFPGWRFMSVKHWGENPVGTWTLKITDKGDEKNNGSFLAWNMALWGSAIDATKATKFVEPVADNALPPNEAPPRPVINDPIATSTTQHAKPTDHLPPDHGHATGDASAPAFPSTTDSPKKKPQDDEVEPGSWYDNVKNAAAGSKLFWLGLLGVGVMCAASLVVGFRRRQHAKKRMEEYVSLAANVDADGDGDDIPMDRIHPENDPHPGGPGSTRRTRFEDQGPHASDEAVPLSHSHNPVDPPPVKGLGFHSSFLDDDEPSAGLSPAPPQYRDEPEGHEHSVSTSHDALRTSGQGHDMRPGEGR